MSKFTINIPHKVGSAEVASPELKKVVMLFMENFNALAAKIVDLQSAVKELAKRPSVSPEIEDIENYVSRSETAATAATTAKEAAIAARNEAVPAGQTATTKAGEAAVSAQNAALSETNASGSATSASQSAQGAAQSAERAETAARIATYINGFAICNVDLGADVFTKFEMASLVPDATKNYTVKVTFNNTSTAAYTCSVTNGVTTQSVEITSRVGTTPTATTEPLIVSGDGYFKIDNQAATVDVIVKIYLDDQNEEQQGG